MQKSMVVKLNSGHKWVHQTSDLTAVKNVERHYVKYT